MYVLSDVLYRYNDEVQSVKISEEDIFLDHHCVPLDAPLMLLTLRAPGGRA